jgi:N-acetylglucosaminyl-diphospho-decaprenol L-rhamnosyltransferase
MTIVPALLVPSPAGPAGPEVSAGVASADPAESPVPTVVDVVIVSYRCRELVLRTIESLAEAGSGMAVSVTVVDNDSRDGTSAAVRERFPHVDVVDAGWNSGFAHAVNMGIARGDGRFVLLLNPDTVVAPDALRVLVSFAEEHPHAGVVAPQLRNADGTDQQTARSFPTPAAAVLGRRSPLTRLFPGNPWSTAYLATHRRAPAGEPFRVDWVSGAAMLVPRAVIERVGGLDDGFFLFWEDADWCRRISDARFEVWCVPAAEVVHDEGGSRAHGWSPRTIRWFHQGAYRYWVKHHASSPWNPARWAAAALLSARAAVLTIHHGLRHRSPQRSQPTCLPPEGRS